MLGNGFKAEIWRCLIITGTSLLAGVILGFPSLVLAIGLLIYVLWLIVQIYHLEDWVHRARINALRKDEELNGLWGDVSYDVLLMLSRHEKEKSRLQTVVNRVQEMTTALTDGVILLDRRANMEWWNRAAKNLFQFKEVDRGHKLTNLIRSPRFIKYFDKGNYGAPLEIAMWQQDQHLEFQVHTFGEGERLVIARDVTRLYRLEQMRKDFVANVSHELRTPLTVIHGYVETLSDTPGIPAPWQKALQQMLQQCQRMTLLINDLLTLTKLETADKDSQHKAVKLTPMISGIVADAKTLSGAKNHEFAITGQEGLEIYGNETELRSAFSNLVVNAVNYSGTGSRIEIHTETNAKETLVSIRDNGMGIDPKHLPRLTERFYRVDQSRSVASGGTGLGLAIVKHVLLRHQAELRITSQPGKGSRFDCCFPKTEDTPAP